MGIFKRPRASARKKKNLAAVFFACFLLAAAVAASALQSEAQTNAENGFIPRLTAPAESDGTYALYSSKNIFYTSGCGMPNCTCYAYGRAYEILGSEPKLCRNDAEEWYDYNKDNELYPYGQEPKEGAIACWQYEGGGHVAVVEAVEGNEIIMSQSAYGYEYFYLTRESRQNPGQKGWDFLGYIYVKS